jgi:hypothetical protein
MYLCCCIICNSVVFIFILIDFWMFDPAAYPFSCDNSHKDSCSFFLYFLILNYALLASYRAGVCLQCV